MGSVAFLFAGQGAQHPAMGVDLIETSPAAAEVFTIADEVRPGTSEQCRSASKEELSQTENTQPCVFVHDLAVAVALRERGVVPAACAGFSLGEVAALSFAGAFDTRAGFELVCERAALMATAAERHPGGMRAVIKLDAAQVENLAAQAGRGLLAGQLQQSPADGCGRSARCAADPRRPSKRGWRPRHEGRGVGCIS